jgi:anti-anti-sigma regulatory factor
MWPHVVGQSGRPTGRARRVPAWRQRRRGRSPRAGRWHGRRRPRQRLAPLPRRVQQRPTDRASGWIRGGPPVGSPAFADPAEVMSSPSRRRPRPSGSSTLNVHLDLQTGRVTAIGRLDGRSAPLLHDAVSVLLDTEQPTLTVDVSGMEVADHAGLRAIGEIYRRALRRGRRITVRGASPQLRSALSRLHLGHHLLFDDAPPTADETPTPTPTP